MAEFLTGLLQALGSRFARVARLEAENLLLSLGAPWSADFGKAILLPVDLLWSKLPAQRNDGQC